MRLLITGASGLLGANLTLAALDAGHQVFATSHQRPLSAPDAHWQPADLTNADQVEALLGSTNPEWIVNCAAATDVDRCEREPEWADSLNETVPRRLARGAKRLGARLIHVSTDAVFDGGRDRYRVDDRPSPVNKYGSSKLAGERAVLTSLESALVARTNFYGWSPPGRMSLAEWFLERLEVGQRSPGFADVRFCPLLVNHLATLLLQLAESKLVGRYHLVARDCLSKYEFGSRIARAFGFDTELVVLSTVAEAGLSASRPRSLALDGSELERDLQVTLPSVDQGIYEFVRLQRAGHRDRLRALVPEPLPQAGKD